MQARSGVRGVPSRRVVRDVRASKHRAPAVPPRREESGAETNPIELGFAIAETLAARAGSTVETLLAEMTRAEAERTEAMSALESEVRERARRRSNGAPAPVPVETRSVVEEVVETAEVTEATEERATEEETPTEA
mmetsp:Transcript_29644/g.96558  ORF Transcript_29644/g.96558 Transcript_29644/m.96558 type:complete len:136 (+) Transcript_29644:2-409(+)